MEAVQTVEYPTFETVWAARMEELRESQKETNRTLDKLAERQKKTDEQLGRLGNRFGEMVEYMVMPCLVEKFRELGFEFEETYPHREIKDKKNNVTTEIDITLENGDKVMIVEVKAKPSTEDIANHLERMEIVRCRADQRNDRRKYLGAIAGMVFNDSEKIYAMKNGFYIIEPSGETFAITVPDGSYAPREW